MQLVKHNVTATPAGEASRVVRPVRCHQQPAARPLTYLRASAERPGDTADKVSSASTQPIDHVLAAYCQLQNASADWFRRRVM